MSKIQGKPFIELVVDTLGDLKTDFLDLVNGSDKTPEFRSLINASAKITDSDKNKVQYVVLETWSKTYTGYLIYNNTYCVLVAFSSNTQALTMLKIDVAKQTFTTVKEYLDINELRRYLEEASEHITSGEIDSGEAAENAFLVADGEGGAEFVSPAEGSAQYLVGLDSEGNIIKDELPEGIVVDQSIVEDSENAVAGGAVYDALAEKADASDVYTKTQVDTALETKANVDGNYPTMTVGAADNLTPYDEDSGVDQEQPFLLQGTGCGNGEQQVDTGALGLLKEKQGHSVVVNQLSQWKVNGTYYDLTLTNNQDGSCSLSGTADPDAYGQVIVGQDVILARDGSRKYLVACFGNGNYPYGINGYGANHTKPFIFDVSGNAEPWYGGITLAMEQGDTVDLSHLIAYVVDLTQWFGSNDNIPAHLLAHPEDFFRYYQGSLAYNEGTLVNANGRYLKTIGRNQWDEEWEQGYLDSSGQPASSNDYIRSKNFIKVIPNATYYIKCPYASYVTFYDKNNAFISQEYFQNYQFVIPSNCFYIKFHANSSTYNHDITISIYYEGESGYDQYYPYEELANIDTGTEVLRSAGSVKDSKAPDGTITRRVGVVDLGTLNWYYNSSNGSMYCENLPDNWCSPTGSGNGNMNGVCGKYANAGLSPTDFYDGNIDKSFIYNSLYISGSKQINIKDTDYTDAATFKTAMSGVMLYYELEEPTTEQGTSFSENVAIDDFGSMDFGGTNNVPQGASIFYAVDYKAFIDSLYNTLDGDATDIVKESELDSKLATLGYVKLTSVSGYDATKTQVLKNVEGTLTWVTEE